jgi:hypothetical protein
MRTPEELTALVQPLLPAEFECRPGFEAGATDPKTELDRDVIVPIVFQRHMTGVRITCAERALPEAELLAIIATRISDGVRAMIEPAASGRS